MKIMQRVTDDTSEMSEKNIRQEMLLDASRVFNISSDDIEPDNIKENAILQPYTGFGE